LSLFDVVVVGGGIVGTATAFELGRAGARTLLVDRADVGRATDAGAGILSPETAKRDDTSWVALVRAAGRHYDQLLPQLDPDSGWARCGILQLATRDSDLPAWEWVAERAAGATEISADEARDMVPVLGSIVRALHHPGAARVDGRKMCAALARAAQQLGVEVRQASVDEVRSAESSGASGSKSGWGSGGGSGSGGRAAVVVDGELVDADAVVIAGGAWTRRLGAQLGVQLPVGPLRGQIAHLLVPEHDTAHWPIVQQVYGHYMVPWDDHRVAVGATVEDAGFAADVTAGGVHEIMREALRVMPGLAGSTLREVRVGLRPASVDDMPLLGPLPGVAGVFVATGHGANGLLLGPVSGAIVADLVLGRSLNLDLDLTPFSPARFQNNSM
jgi:glycine/D-amino acid oxidase-like deaminating enzyme